MKTNQDNATLLEELLYWGTPLDQEMVEAAMADRKGLEVIQTGSCVENTVFAKSSGGVEIITNVAIVNVSGHVEKLKAARLNSPWLDSDFAWLKKPVAEQSRKWGGYVLPALGPGGFDLDRVLNHKFGRGFELQPDQQIEGFLLGAGTSSLPNDYGDRDIVPVQLVVSTGRGHLFGSWLKLSVDREVQPTILESARGRVARSSKPAKGAFERK